MATDQTTEPTTGPASRRTRRHEAARRGSPVQIGLALLALAVGGFAIGTTEFVSMGLLPQLASGVDVSIPTAGHVISAYALGVVVGAPLIAVFGARLPRRELLVGLMVVFLVGNAASALATGFTSLTVARFFAGLPHGAYFGVASLVAADLVTVERRGRAVSRVMLGLAVANLAGVPAATFLGQHAGWRSAYWLVTVLAALTAGLVLWLVPHVAANRDATGRTELRAFKNPQVLLTLLAGAAGFGGMFAVYTYIAPTVTDVAGLAEGRVPFYLLAFGLGMVVGTPLGGRLADWSIFRSLLVSSVAMIVVLVSFTVTSQWFVPGLVTAFALTVFGSVLVTNLQMRLMQVAGDAQTIGAAMNHASLNIANALGAWLGGVVVAAGFGYTSPAWVGAGLSVVGLVVLLASAVLHRRTAPATQPAS
jgi:DHA1 family inner membrane transport protein